MTPEQLFESLLTATSAHKAGGSGTERKQRDAWLRQFIFAFANDEGGEGTSFQGTIPQALMMMNGELMQNGHGGRSRELPGRLRGQALGNDTGPVRLSGRTPLLALSRYPTRKETQQAAHYLATRPDSLKVLQDLFWALLNSNEFVLNRYSEGNGRGFDRCSTASVSQAG